MKSDDVLVQWAADFRRVEGHRMLKVAYSSESNHHSRSLLMKQESLFALFLLQQNELFSTPERPAITEEKLIHHHLVVWTRTMSQVNMIPSVNSKQDKRV